jgi:hypothetical protein
MMVGDLLNLLEQINQQPLCGNNMAIAKIDQRKKLSKGRVGCTFIDSNNQSLVLSMGTVITDINGNNFRITAKHSDDGDFIPVLSLSDEKLTGDKFEYYCKE